MGSQARILYSNEEGRASIALAFNKAVSDGRLKVRLVISTDYIIVPFPDPRWEPAPACVYHTESLDGISCSHSVLCLLGSSYCKSCDQGYKSCDQGYKSCDQGYMSCDQGYKSCDCHTGITQGPVVLSRDHHDVSGTDRYV